MHSLSPDATDPATASEGDVYFNTAENVYKVYRAGSWLEDDSAALALGLASSIGLSFIGQVDSAESLRITPAAPGDRISLASYFTGLGCGGGEFIYTADTVAADDGGTIFRVNENYVWKRKVIGAIDATWFGVTGDGVDRGTYVNAALNYIIAKGGELVFPNGTVNFGTLRYANSDMNGPSFILTGYGTNVIWENVDPIPIDITTTNYTSETTLIQLGTDPSGYGRGDYFPSFIIEGFTFDYANQSNKGGNTYATMGAGPHPTPYSCGTTMLDIWGSYHPIVRNCTFQNCWGNALRFRNCNSPYVGNVSSKDVAANEILDRLNGSESSDSFGSGCFLWGCYNGCVENSQFINTKVYLCDPALQSSNGTVYNGTLCGYIGCYCEYPLGVDDVAKVPPGVTSITDASGAALPFADDTQHGTFKNVTVSGYVLGIKGENSTNISVTDCKAYNCYLPLLNASSMYVQGGVYDKTECSYLTNPQNGYQFQAAVICNGSFSGDYPTSQFTVDGASVYCRSSRAFVNSKGHNRIINCDITISDAGTVHDQLTENTIYVTEFSGNHIQFLPSTIELTSQVRVTNTNTFKMHHNTFINENASAIITIGTGDSSGSLWTINDNTFNGSFKILFNGAVNNCIFS
ncbi:hypothetical protein ABK905_18940 [Acerihabitans sp. KWT182]|uniref:Right-handed parallel beta-helix repeat-containing protein n=1 Tax=Acerihabitans sp. KWT182 TaxID=3157919 RepID=A0AAU7Q6L1_9GAMM